MIGLGHWATETHLKRFRREAEAAASLEHPWIVPIYEIGERDGACYFSMKLEEGGQLDQLVRGEGVPLRRAAEIIASLARTVHYAHERGICIVTSSREYPARRPGRAAPGRLRPGRLVETESTVTRTLEVLGTPSYIAPEQAAGKMRSSRARPTFMDSGRFFINCLQVIRLSLVAPLMKPSGWF